MLRIAFFSDETDAKGKCLQSVGDATPKACNGVEHHVIAPLNSRVEGLLAALACGRAGGRCKGTWRRWTLGDAALPALTAADKAQPSARVLFVDNLDSFSLNIVNAFAALDAEVVVVSGRGAVCASAEQVLDGVRPTHILLGPGPGRPEASSLTMAFARMSLDDMLKGLPVLGICLGHQALGVASGWELAPSPLGAVHGVPEDIRHDGQQLFTALPPLAKMVRYNSLVLRLPAGFDQADGGGLKVAAWDSTGQLIMGLRHSRLPVCGVQFHPESAGSCGGNEIFKAFLTMK